MTSRFASIGAIPPRAKVRSDVASSFRCTLTTGGPLGRFRARMSRELHGPCGELQTDRTRWSRLTAPGRTYSGRWVREACRLCRSSRVRRGRTLTGMNCGAGRESEMERPVAGGVFAGRHAFPAYSSQSPCRAFSSSSPVSCRLPPSGYPGSFRKWSARSRWPPYGCCR